MEQSTRGRELGEIAHKGYVFASSSLKTWKTGGKKENPVM
jgi:hypothetical protein